MKRCLFAISLLCWALVPPASVGQQFAELEVTLSPTSFGALALGDLNADGLLDVVISGIHADGTQATKIYRNNGFRTGNQWSFMPMADDLPGFEGASIDLGDYDNDNDLDILLTGGGRTLLYRNDRGTFTFVSIGLPGVERVGGITDIVSTASAAWGDYDNDGDLDILLTGGSTTTQGSSITALYRNDGQGRFTETNIALPEIIHGSVEWGDYDTDGDFDLLISSRPTDGMPRATVLRNERGELFVDQQPPLPNIDLGSLSWRDFDNDGDLDILVTGGILSAPPPFAEIYRNDNGRFVRLDEALPPSWFGAWMDVNNDGLLEVLLNGTSSTFETFIQLVDTNADAPELGTAFQGVWWGAIALGDIDGDHDMDVLTTGSVQGGTTSSVTSTFHSNTADTVNVRPEPPTFLDAFFEGNDLVFMWNEGNDHETPTLGLSYNIRVGTRPGASDVMSPMARPDGVRLLPKLGNVGHNRSWRIRGLDPGRTYYWTVQTIDSNLEGSAFAEEQRLTLASGVSNDEAVPAESSRLHPAYPNPFAHKTTIRYAINQASYVELGIYDVLGNEVARLYEGHHEHGTFEMAWKQTPHLASGVYFCRLTVNAQTHVQPLLYVP